MSHAFVLGASSRLAKSVCKQLAPKVARFTLVGRNAAELERLKTDLQARHGNMCDIVIVDLLGAFDATAIVAKAEEAAGPISHAFSFPGSMGSGDRDDPKNIASIAQVNYVGPAQFLTALAARMEQRKAGHIVVISSVAGDRGRASNYAYGAAKAALSTFAAGLRHRLHAANVKVLTAKPGFIATPMTDGMQSKLMATPEHVAAIILGAMEKGRGTVYAPWFWFVIMSIIRHIPGPIFNKLKL